MSGWIKIDRSIRNNWVWDCEFSYGQAWVDLILNAAHRDGSAMIKSQVIKYKRGDQLRSELTLSSEWGWSRGKVRRFLKNLENDGMIVQQKGHLTTIISICNYDTFQLGLIDNGTTDSTTDGTTDGHLTVHRQECKELKKVKNNNIRKIPFDDFYSKYPVKKSKAAAEKKWNSMKIQKQQEAIDGIAGYMKANDPNYYVHPSTYLNGERWEDKPFSPESTPEVKREVL